MLRSNEWFTTYDAETASLDENTFPSPGRVHLFATNQVGVTYSTSTTIGYLWVSYEVELGFPSAPTDTTVPARRSASSGRSVDHVCYTDDEVGRYYNFVAGCYPRPSFYDFLSLFQENGEIDMKRASRYDPDEQSLTLVRPFSAQSSNFFVKIKSRERNPFVSSASEADSADEVDKYYAHWTQTGVLNVNQ